MPEDKRDTLDILAKAAQVLAVVIGVVISVLSFNATRQKEAEARIFELQKYSDQQHEQNRRAQVEAAKPFVELRQKLYMEVIQNAGILANPSTHDSEEIKKATKRFWELYRAELCMVESKGVEGAMVGLGEALTDSNASDKIRQDASVKLARVLRDSLVESWGIVDKTTIGAVNK